MEDKENELCEIEQPLFCSEIVIRAPSILESGDWTDCKIVVGAEPHQVVVGGYKLVMAWASPVFATMFYGSLAETRDHIPIVDVEPEIFKAMLQYIYTDNINISSWSEACHLYYAAKKYMLERLMELCSKYLQNNLNIGNVCQIYEHSLLFEDDALTQECNKMFSDDTRDLLKDNSFTAAELNTVTTIFSLDELNLDSELDLIEAAARYAEAHGIKNKEETLVTPVSSASMGEIDKQPTCGPSNLNIDTAEKQLIRSAVKHIRFLTLTSQQYASCAARYSLLTLPEDHAVLMNIAYDKSDVPMPSGLSTSRVDRISKTSFFSRIEGYHGNNTVTSQKHYFRKLKWQIKLSPYTYYHSNDSLYIHLLCTNESESSSWSCDASAELRIISQTPGAKPLICNFQHVFSQRESEFKTQRFPKSDFVNNKYLKDASVEMEVLIKMFSDDTRDLLKDNSFTAAELNTVTTIFSLDELNLDSELDLIEAAARYAEAHGIKNKEETLVTPVSSASMGEIDKQPTCGPSNLNIDTAEKQLIRSAVKHIRFLTLTSQQYASCAARYSLLTLPEDHAVLMNIAYDKSDVPMPSGLSTSRVDRISKTSFFSRIEGYHGNNTVTSQKHYFRKLKWQIKLSPYTYYHSNDSLYIHLLCTNESESSSWSCDASAELRIISQTPGAKPLICNFQHVFSQRESEFKTQRFPKSDFVNNKYLKDASVEMEVLIKVN